MFKVGDQVVIKEYASWEKLTGIIDSVYDEDGMFGSTFIVDIDDPVPEFQPMSHKPEIWIKLAKKLVVHEISLERRENAQLKTNSGHSA